MNRRTSGLLVLLASGLALAPSACVAQTSGESGDVASTRPDTGADDAASCAAASAAALLMVEDGGACPLELALADDRLQLRRLAQVEAEDKSPAVVAAGAAPSSCGADLSLCSFEAHASTLGPILLVAERGYESEMPTQVHVGWVDQERLVFAPSWHGLPSVVDHTRVGPPYALAPHDCGGRLQLLPMARLPEAGVEAPPAELLALAGAWTVDEAGEALPPAQADAGGGGGCTALLDALP
ncbi:MAG: hypothetical protein KC457_10235 [Myxococcales bacterium]|nr:hypothetical protein [Myxococcales bacterium]